MSYIVVTSGWFIDPAGRIPKNRGHRIRKSRNYSVEAAAFNRQIYPYNSFDLKRTCLFAAVNHEVFPGNSFDSESLWEKKHIPKSILRLEVRFLSPEKIWSQWKDHVVNRDPGLQIISKLLASKTEIHPKVFFYWFFSWTGHHLSLPGKLAIVVSSLYTWSTS